MSGLDAEYEEPELSPERLGGKGTERDKPSAVAYMVIAQEYHAPQLTRTVRLARVVPGGRRSPGQIVTRILGARGR